MFLASLPSVWIDSHDLHALFSTRQIHQFMQMPKEVWIQDSYIATCLKYFVIYSSSNRNCFLSIDKIQEHNDLLQDIFLLEEKSQTKEMKCFTIQCLKDNIVLLHLRRKKPLR